MTSEFNWPIRVYYEDTDAGGVVYYANYLKFMERARTEWLRTLGFEQDRLRDEFGVLFAVSRVEVNYRRPARFNESLSVGVNILRLGRASLELAQVVHRSEGELLCDGTVRIACIAADSFTARPIPESVRQGIEA